MIDRRRALALLSAAALGGTVMGRSAGAFVERQERERRPDAEGRGGTDDQLLYTLPLRLRDRQLAITTIFLLGISQFFILRTLAGVDQRNENRVNLTAIPFLGGLARRAYGASDFTTANRFGSVYAEGTAMFIYLFPELRTNPEVRQILLFNLLSSFSFRDNYQLATWQMMAALMPNFCAIDTVRRVMEARLSRTAPAAVTPSPAEAGTAFAPGEMDHLLLAGLVSDTADSSRAGVPVLGDAPLLGKLFAGAAHKASDEQLLIMVRPSIVMGDPERS